MPSMAVSEKFILAERFLSVEAPADSTFAGFTVEVRQNLSNGERRVLIEALDAIQAEADATVATLRGEGEQIDAELRDETVTDKRLATRRRNAMIQQLNSVAADMRRVAAELIAPHVRDWNAYEPGPDGPVKAPPPAVAGPEAFDAITDEMSEWVKVMLLAAYRSGKGVTNRSTPPGGSQGPTGGPKRASGKATSTSRIPRSQTTSAGPSVSTFQA